MKKTNCSIMYPLSMALLYLLCLGSCSAKKTPATDINTDQSALLSLKAHITSDPHAILANNWSTAADSVCSWIGVTCGIRHQRVVALDLSVMGLQGTIPPHVGNLSFLVSFNITMNSFHGHLPQELGRLHRLQLIDWRQNNFDGGLPSWFSNLPKLKLLSIVNNSFTGTIPPSLCNISELEGLDLQLNLLDGTIPQEIGNLRNLRWLNMRDNQLSGEIPMSLYECSKLEGLWLDRNNFFGPIAKEIGNLTMLKEIWLSDNNFAGDLTVHTETIGTIGYVAPEYGLQGLTSTMCDVYSYGIMLIETFTRRRPTDEMFAGDTSLWTWVNDSFPNALVQVVDVNLLKEEENNYLTKVQCVKSIMELAIHCSTESPTQRMQMNDILTTLKKIKFKFVANLEG